MNCVCANNNSMQIPMKVRIHKSGYFFLQTKTELPLWRWNWTNITRRKEDFFLNGNLMFLNRLTHSIVQMLLSDARLCSQRMSGRVLSIFLYFSHIIDYTPKKWLCDISTRVNYVDFFSRATVYCSTDFHLSIFFLAFQATVSKL